MAAQNIVYVEKKWVIVLRYGTVSRIIIHDVWNKDYNLIQFYYVSIILRYFVIIFHILFLYFDVWYI